MEKEPYKAALKIALLDAGLTVSNAEATLKLSDAISTLTLLESESLEEKIWVGRHKTKPTVTVRSWFNEATRQWSLQDIDSAHAYLWKPDGCFAVVFKDYFWTASNGVL